MTRITVRLALIMLAVGLFASCRETPSDPVTPVGKDTVLADLYDAVPNAGACSEGTLKQSEKKKVLDYLNAIRARHGLEAVDYRDADDLGTAKAALIIAANNTLNHQPPNTLKCWTQQGFDASGTSNLAWQSFSGAGVMPPKSEAFIAQWLTDQSVTNLGHRRWLLDPFLAHVSFGRVDNVDGTSLTSGAAIKVIYADNRDLSGSSVEYVAYPYHDYAQSLYNPQLDMSFSVLADRSDFWKNGSVDFSGATITITADGGGTVAAHDIRTDNQAFGLANCLMWRADVQNDVKYTVRITNVVVNGAAKSYEYWFALRANV